jgi:hypothetical protein
MTYQRNATPEPMASDPWVRYNPATNTYDTKDGTKVASEVVESVECLADVLRVATIREKQR